MNPAPRTLGAPLSGSGRSRALSAGRYPFSNRLSFVSNCGVLLKSFLRGARDPRQGHRTCVPTWGGWRCPASEPLSLVLGKFHTLHFCTAEVAGSEAPVLLGGTPCPPHRPENDRDRPLPSHCLLLAEPGRNPGGRANPGTPAVQAACQATLSPPHLAAFLSVDPVPRRPWLPLGSRHGRLLRPLLSGRRPLRELAAPPRRLWAPATLREQPPRSLPHPRRGRDSCVDKLSLRVRARPSHSRSPGGQVRPRERSAQTAPGPSNTVTARDAPCGSAHRVSLCSAAFERLLCRPALLL